MDSVFGQRLRQTRLARGLTLDALAAAMGGIVTKQAIGKYEQGQAQPSPLVLNRLAAALDIKAATLWREPAVRIEILAYRKRASLPVREREAIESVVSLVSGEIHGIDGKTGRHKRAHRCQPQCSMLEQKSEDSDRQREDGEHHREVIDEKVHVGPGHHHVRELAVGENWRDGCPRKLTADLSGLLRAVT